MRYRNSYLFLVVPLVILALLAFEHHELRAGYPNQSTSSAQYRVTLNAEWSASTHPTDFPPNPHFSGLTGGIHTSSVSFWSPGAIASDGIEQMAETGSTNIFQSEINTAINNGTAGWLVAGSGIPNSPGSVSIDFSIRDDYPLITLVAMIAPSPDWFVGVHGVSLQDSQGNWVNNLTVSLDPYDAGTDSSPSYLHSENDTQPPEPIRNVRGQFPFSNARIGTMSFVRLDAPSQPTNTPTPVPPTPIPPTSTAVPPTPVPPTPVPPTPVPTQVPPTATSQPPTPPPTPPPSASCGGLRQEAEVATIGSGASGNGAFSIGQDGAASGGTFIQAQDARASGAYNPSANATYCVTVPSSGTYGIKTRAKALDPLHNSLFLYVDGQPVSGYTWHLWATSDFVVTDLYVAQGDNPNLERLELNLSAGEHEIAFAGRESGAMLDWFELVALSGGSQPPAPTPAPTATPVPGPTTAPTPPPSGTCGLLQQEAEDGDLSGQFTIGADGSASGGQYVSAPNGVGNRGAVLDSSQAATYCVQVNQAGTYRLKAWTYGVNGFDNSFYIQINGQPSQGIVWHTPINTSYQSDYVRTYDVDANTFDELAVSLPAGEHEIKFLLREDGTRLDRFALEQVVSAASVPHQNAPKTIDGWSQLANDIVILERQQENRLYVPLFVD